MKKEQIEDFTDWLIDREECVNEINKEKLALSKENQLRRKIIKLETDKQKLIEKLEEDKMKEFDDYTICLIESYLKILKGES